MKKRKSERREEENAPSPLASLAGGDLLEIRGRSGIVVRGCRRILGYSREEISLLLHGYVLTIRGRRLDCRSYCVGAVCIDGILDGLDFRGERPL